MVHDQVDRGAGDDRRELFRELDRLEEQMRGAIEPDRLERDADASVVDAAPGRAGAEEVAAELFDNADVFRAYLGG